MKITYKDYEIEEDRNGFILTRYSITPERDKNGNINKTAWEKVVADQTYPTTLERCFEKILHHYKRSALIELELKDAIQEIKRIDEQFIIELRELLNNK